MICIQFLGEQKSKEKTSTKVLAEIDTNKASTSNDLDDFDVYSLDESFEEMEDFNNENKENSRPILTQGKNSGIRDDFLLNMRSEQQITYQILENQRKRMDLLQQERMEMLKKRRRTD